MDISDEELIEKYLAGDEYMLKLLIDRYTPPLYNFVVRFVGASYASDIVQEVFIKAWKNLKKFDISKAHFKTWIFTIARNTTTDYLRKKKSIVFSDLETIEEESFSETIVDETPLPDEVFAVFHESKNINSILSELPVHYQAVLTLYYQEDMTFAQIGESLGKPLNTVKSHHRRALQQLRTLLSSGVHQI